MNKNKKQKAIDKAFKILYNQFQQVNRENSYQEWWRDWPFEAQQPVNIHGAKSCDF